MGAERYEILSTLPPGAGTRTRLAWQVGGSGFRRAVVLRQIPDGAQTQALPSMPQSVLSMLDRIEMDGSGWAVYEFIAGATFAEVASAHFDVERLPSLGLIVRAVIDAARAIHQVHAFEDPLGLVPPITHGGLSDASIFIGFDGKIRILDLGARRLGKFIAPEMTRGEPFDARADVFSLGAVLHHAATRFGKPYAATLARAPSAQEFPPPSSVHPEATPELDAVVMRALMIAPTSRFTSALQLAEELEAAMGANLFTTEQLHTVLLPLFGARVAALRELVDPAQHPPAPRASAPRPTSSRKQINEPPLLDSNVIRLDGDAEQDVEDLPTQANIHVPPSRKPIPPPLEQDANPTNPRRAQVQTSPDAPAVPVETRPSRPSVKRSETAEARRPLVQDDEEREAARGQEKISTADLDPDQLSPEMRALQSEELGAEIEAVPTNIKPRLSQTAMPALSADGEVADAGFQDPKKGESTMEVEPSPVTPKPRSVRRLVIVALVMAMGFGVAVVKFRPDLVQKLKETINPVPPGAEEVVVEDVDGGEPAAAEVDAGGGAPSGGVVAVVDAGAPVRIDAGISKADAGDDDDDDAVGPSDAGSRDGGKGKAPPGKKKKKKKTR